MKVRGLVFQMSPIIVLVAIKSHLPNDNNKTAIMVTTKVHLVGGVTQSTESYGSFTELDLGFIGTNCLLFSS